MRYLALVLAALVGLASPVSAAPLVAPHVAMPTCTRPWTCKVEQHGSVIVQYDRNDTIVWGAPAGWHYIVDAGTHVAYFFPTLDDTTTFSNGFLRNQDGALVTALDSGSTVNFLAPLPGNANTAGGANQSIGIQAYDGSTNMVPLQEVNNALNVNLKSQDAGLVITDKIQPSTDTIVSTSTLQSGTCTPPCNQTLITGAKTLLGLVFLSSTAMVSGQTLTCFDNTAASGTIIMQAAQMGAGQIVTIPGGGESLTLGLNCQLAGTAFNANQFIQALAR